MTQPTHKFQPGDHVIKNPATWKPSEFDACGAGEGVGVIVVPPYPLDPELVDVRWPGGRCFQYEAELLPAPTGQVCPKCALRYQAVTSLTVLTGMPLAVPCPQCGELAPPSRAGD